MTGCAVDSDDDTIAAIPFDVGYQIALRATATDHVSILKFIQRNSFAGCER